MSEKRVFQASQEGHVEVKSTEGEPSPPGLTPESLTFAAHVHSLNAAALVHLGLIADPDAGDSGPHKDLEAARHVIDTLAMFREKTRGNLSADESNLLDTVVHDLRIRFVQTR